MRPRVIPVLLLKDQGLYKTIKFKNPKYVGDPINALRIFCEKEVDEIIVLDIGASAEGTAPQLDFIRDLASECFMPLAYGGGVSSLELARAILRLGVEKVVVNTAAVKKPELISEIAAYAGSSAVVVSLDAKRNFFGGYELMIEGGRRSTGRDPVEFARLAEKLGTGEVLINSIDRDGTMNGYDTRLVESVAQAVDVPVIACGGAGSMADFRNGLSSGADAVAAGSMFVFHGKHRAVLITYPTPAEVECLTT